MIRTSVMSSLGPKLTSVALYQIHRQYPQIALVYAPSGEYNPNYSKGIGDTITGVAMTDKAPEPRAAQALRSSARWRRRPCWSSNGVASTIPSDPTAPAAAYTY